MPILRFAAICLPQFLLLLPLGASLNLLGDWNHSDAGFNTLLLLFLITPVVTLTLLVTESVRARKAKRRGLDPISLFWVRVAMLLCAETLAINLALLSQVKL